MGKTVPIQNVYCSNQDYRKICSIDTEVIDTPTAPLIHQMSRFWLINEGQGVLKLQDREYKLLPGTIVSILPWQISDVIQVDAPLQYYLLAYYFDNIKSVYNADSKPVSLIEEMTATPVVHCDEGEYEAIRTIFEQLRTEMGVESVSPADSGDEFHTLYLKNKLVELIVLFCRATERSRVASPPARAEIHKSDVLHYMYNHLSEKLTLSNLSKLFFMSESSISNYITLTTGLSFFDLLNEMRVGKTINFLLYTNLTLEELAEEGLIRADPDSGFEEFPAGLLLTVEDSIEADGRHTFSLQKYRSSLGAYCFYDCTARQEGDGWSYVVGAEMIS